MIPQEAKIYAEMGPEQFAHPDRFGFMAQGALIMQYLIEGKGTQEEWVETFAPIFRILLATRETDWRTMTSDPKKREEGLRAIQNELDAATIKN